jgi:hypothetical protein
LGNGREEIFRYVLPSEGSGPSGSTVSVRENSLVPGPLAIPSDSPNPEKVLFAGIDLPAEANSPSGQQQAAPGNTAQSGQESNETADKPADSNDEEKSQSDLEKSAQKFEETVETVNKVEETAKKAKKLFKGLFKK